MKLNMKLRQGLLAALFLASATPLDDGSKAVLALERKLNDAQKRGDIAASNVLLTNYFIITVEDGTTYSKPGYIARLSDPSEHVDLSKMTDLKVRIHGNIAVVTGEYHEKGTSKGKSYEYRDRLTDVWVNGEGKWQVLVSHYSISQT